MEARTLSTNRFGVPDADLESELEVVTQSNNWCGPPPPGGYGGVEEAYRQGDIFRREVMARMPTLFEAAALAGMPPRELSELAEAGKALAMEDEVELRFPAWQFRPEVWSVLPRVISLSSYPGHPWNVYLFFTRGEPLLGGRTPLAVLRNDEERGAAEVVRVAKIMAGEHLC